MNFLISTVLITIFSLKRERVECGYLYNMFIGNLYCIYYELFNILKGQSYNPIKCRYDKVYLNIEQTVTAILLF
ncbi:hypothetical protein A0H76_2227 [Hepatospora eriocheir]|uniref:Uncharacterized protein n=1 Tax=Hepatospora eriocheir TaxID=1081669 RepID=A0A1X0QFN2_9MICR|nr:hypothetical protein A0H76_2227 [Hepatospora eriocheir]